MKNMALTLMSIMVSLLFARYYPYIPRKLVTEYITVAGLSICQALRFGKSVNGHDGGLKMHKA